MRLSHPRHFRCRSEAENAIEEMKKDEQEDYFKGTFVHRHSNYFVFAFSATLRASDADLDRLKIPVQKRRTDVILPKAQSTLIEIEVDLLVVTRVGLKQAEVQGKQQAIKRVLSIVEDMHMPEAKKVKRQVELFEQEVKREVVQSTSAISMPERTMIEIKPDENDRTKHIVEQMRKFAERKGMQVYTNQSKISDWPSKHFFSKYATSQPDITVYDSTQFTIVTADKKKVAYLCPEKSDNGEADVTQELRGLTLTCETKLKDTDAKVLGQLLAGMDKTLGDIFDTLMMQDSVLSELTMYGLALNLEANSCKVIKADVVIGRKTRVYEGQRTLPIADAVNRVFHQLVK